MAATATTDAHAELISSLSQDEIPIKLRCAICSRLAVNAFRLPCCEQAICETCQSTLPSSCPVCEHTPVAAEDCKPNKSLRTTIKVFLRTEEKKREALRSKEVKNSPPPTPLDTIETPVEAPIPADAIDSKPELSSTPAQDHVEKNPETTTETPHNAEQDIPQPSIEEVAPEQEPSGEIVEKEANEAGNAVLEGEGVHTTESATIEVPASGQSVSQAAGTGTGLGFNANAASAFPAMGFGGDFNQIQMMMAMQNGGMAPNAFGNFPMMGMHGIGMDPMAMQNMFMNGGFSAGMSGMSMGAGMGGFDGGVGAGFSNEWNGQQSWNVGPDNFNHPNAAGMGTGDYGSNNAGYNPHASRFNQGNYGHGNQYNDYSNYGYQSRGRGRGRGGYGRGGYAHQLPQQFGPGEGYNGSNNETGTTPTGPKAVSAPDATSNVDEFGREIRPASEAKDNAATGPASKNDSEAVQGQDHDGTDINQDSTPKDAPGFADDNTPKPIQTLDEVQGFGQNGYNGIYKPGMSRGFPGHGGYNPMQPVKPVDVPINAPTGPKAMRDGLPNTGISGLRVRGYQVPAIPNSRTTESVSAPPEPVIGENGKGGQRSKSPSREKSRDREGGRPRSRDRRRSRSRDRRHRRQRNRSASASEDEKESERRRERRRERHRRREEEGDNGEDASYREQQVDDTGRDIEGEKSRSASPSDSRRSSHRSRRDRDKYRERDRDSDKEYKSSSHKHRSSNRHRGDRSRSRDRDREHRHRHSRRASEEIDDKHERHDRSTPPTPIEAEDTSRRPSAATNSAIEIKGASSRRKPTLDEIIIPTGPRQDRISSAREREKDYDRGKENCDSRRHRDDDDARYRSSRHRDADRERPKEKHREKDREKDRARVPPAAPAAQDAHTLEREARNRERLLKEAQRIAGLTGMSGAKRGREEADDARKGRKKGRRGEDGDEARMARLEAERESVRWN